MKTFREYVSEMDLSKERPATEIIDLRPKIKTEPGKGNLQPVQTQRVAPGKGSLPVSSAPKPPIPRLKPKL